jgi:hypothetical protein
MAVSDVVVGAAGALVIVTALIGVVVIENRAGPYEYALEATAVTGEAAGFFRATSGGAEPQLPGDCVPVPDVITCTAPHLRVELTVSGLPEIPGHAYVAFLHGAAGGLFLGSLESTAGGSRLVHEAAVDASGYTQLLVTLEAPQDVLSSSGAVLYAKGLGTGSDREVSLEGILQPLFPAADGDLRLSQIGAVSVSALASGTLRSVEPIAGFAYRAWLSSGDAHTRLGDYTFDAAGVASLDVRVERVVLAAHERFLVTLEPVASDAGAPLGLPVASAPL